MSGIEGRNHCYFLPGVPIALYAEWTGMALTTTAHINPFGIAMLIAKFKLIFNSPINEGIFEFLEGNELFMKR